MTTPLTSLTFLVVACGSFVTARAQVPVPAQQGAAEQMTLHVTVDSRSGSPVGGLTTADFKLLDNKKEQPIVSVREVKKQPTRIVIVIDGVNLPFSEVSFARQQLTQFFSANEGKLAEPTTLAILQDTGMQIVPTFTTDGNMLRAKLDHSTIGLREMQSASGIYAAQQRMQTSVTNMESLFAELPKEGPARMVWVSAGWPLISGPQVHLSASGEDALFGNVVGLITELRKRHIIIDDVNPAGAAQSVVSTDYYEAFLHAPRNARSVQLGDLGLQVLAVDSGGLVLNGSNDLGVMFQHILAEPGDYYEVSFTPAPGEHENEYHQLQLKMNRSGLTAHTTAGYYARPNYPPLQDPGTTRPL